MRQQIRPKDDALPPVERQLAVVKWGEGRPAEGDIVGVKELRRHQARPFATDVKQPEQGEGPAPAVNQFDIGLPTHHGYSRIVKSGDHLTKPATLGHDIAIEKDDDLALALGCSQILLFV